MRASHIAAKKTENGLFFTPREASRWILFTAYTTLVHFRGYGAFCAWAIAVTTPLGDGVSATEVPASVGPRTRLDSSADDVL